MGPDLYAVRSALFLPASNPRAIAKARESSADLVILDLEDAVKPVDKEAARNAAFQAVGRDWPMPVAIRINGVGTPWHEEDVAAIEQARPAFAVVPKVESPDQIVAIHDRVELPLIAMIETPAAVLHAHAIATAKHYGLAGVLAGTNDLRAELRIPRNASRSSISTALQTIVLAARATGVAVFDGVFNGLDDANGFAAECREARDLGFDGKCLIHPNQIETCNRIFSPGEVEIEQARALVAAASGGAERFGGEMVEEMHVAAARRLLERARP